MTTSFVPSTDVRTARGVYAPQEDSILLCEVMERTGLAPGRRVADLCTGSGILAVTAARLGAASVTAFDVSDAAVRCATANARAAGVDVDVRLGNCLETTSFGTFDLGTFDLVVCNPPYVPEPPNGDAAVPENVGPAGAFNAGVDGRLVLDPLCAQAGTLLGEDGTLLVVHSEFSDVDASLAILRGSGLKASVVARRRIPFGPVFHARAAWLEDTGRLEYGRRTERIVVIRADIP